MALKYSRLQWNIAYIVQSKNYTATGQCTIDKPENKQTNKTNKQTKQKEKEEKKRKTQTKHKNK
jgi:hypothetical protein